MPFAELTYGSRHTVWELSDKSFGLVSYNNSWRWEFLPDYLFKILKNKVKRDLTFTWKEAEGYWKGVSSIADTSNDGERESEVVGIESSIYFNHKRVAKSLCPLDLNIRYEEQLL